MKRKPNFKFSERKRQLLKQLYYVEHTLSKETPKEVVQWVRGVIVEELRKL